jgi:transcriptional regulator with XRE-family HTH domain
MDNLAKKLGKNIKICRIKQDMSQAELAFTASLDQSYLSKIENGSVNIAVAKLYSIAEAMNCNPVELLPDYDEL